MILRGVVLASIVTPDSLAAQRQRRNPCVHSLRVRFGGELCGLACGEPAVTSSASST